MIKQNYALDFLIQIYNLLSKWNQRSIQNRHIVTHDDVIKCEHFPRCWPFCAGNLPVPGEFPTQRPVTWSLGVFFDLHLNKRLSKQSWVWWFETLLCPLWRHHNDIYYTHIYDRARNGMFLKLREIITDGQWYKIFNKQEKCLYNMKCPKQ